MTEKEKRKQEMMAAMDARKKQKKLTPELYMDLKADGQSDAKIMKKYGFHTVSFTKWKEDNGLKTPKKPQQATQKPKKEKVMNDMEMVDKAKYDELESNHETLRLRCNSLDEDVKHLKKELHSTESVNKEVEWENGELRLTIGRKNEEITRLTDKVADLEEALAQSDQVSEMTSLQYELERLKKTEAEHLKLEVEHRNLRNRFHAVEEELEFYRDYEILYRLSSKKHIAILDKLDEVMA